jgi:hypothetical protein
MAATEEDSVAMAATEEEAAPDRSFPDSCPLVEWLTTNS